MADNSPFAPFVPGFDFLQGLVNHAGAALPGMGQWVSPTLNPQELEKRIDELRTVQFWLEQNARMLGATIQALEVQRMTLSTLQTMNVQMGDLRDSLKIKTPAAAPATASAPPPHSPAIASAATTEPASAPSASPSASPSAAPPSGAMPPGVDPMQWWGALTQQFTQLAAHAMKQSATDVGQHLATGRPPASPAAAPHAGAASSRTAGKAVGAKPPPVKPQPQSSSKPKTKPKTKD